MGTIKQRKAHVARSYGAAASRARQSRRSARPTTRPDPDRSGGERDAASPMTEHIDHRGTGASRFALARGRRCELVPRSREQLRAGRHGRRIATCDVTIMWLVSERRGRADGDGDGTEHDRIAGEPRWSLSQRTGHSTVEFKSSACAAAGEPSAPPLSALPDPQQFNIFPAFFSRQLNFTSSGACGQGAKIMEELRPNLVGGLLGVPGLLDEHQADAKYLSSVGETKYTPDKGRKCSNASSSSAEEFGGLYSGEHTATPPTPALSRSLQDHTGKLFIFYTLSIKLRPDKEHSKKRKKICLLTS